MKGTVKARNYAPAITTPLGPLERAGTVLATTLASAVVAVVCSYVVFTQVVDARVALSGATDSAVETPTAAASRYLYPEGRASGLSALLGFTDPTLPERSGPAIDLSLFTPGANSIAWPSAPATAPAIDPSTTQARLAALAPTPRPGTIEEIAAAATALAEGLSPAISPIPRARPEDFAARIPARAPAPDIAVARAADPSEEVTLARLEDNIDTGATLRIVPEDRLIGSNPCNRRSLTADIPNRSRRAAGGAVILAAVGDASGGGRDGALIAEARDGNIPSHLRDLQPVVFTGIAGGRQTQVVLCVMPDYLAVGSDDDHVRIPLGLPAALQIAEEFDMMLPTTAMVDQIYAQADLRLSPRPMTPGSAMSTTSYFRSHDATVDAQIASAGGLQGRLIAGHKKDVVLANRLSTASGRVAIYGWHRSPGNPIQPLSTVHGAYYADYSHGVRLVSRTAFVDGQQVDLRTLLTSGTYAGLLNRDGVLNSATIRLAAL